MTSGPATVVMSGLWREKVPNQDVSPAGGFRCVIEGDNSSACIMPPYFFVIKSR